jgi:hypothetical protein
MIVTSSKSGVTICYVGTQLTSKFTYSSEDALVPNQSPHEAAFP